MYSDCFTQHTAFTMSGMVLTMSLVDEKKAFFESLFATAAPELKADPKRSLVGLLVGLLDRQFSHRLPQFTQMVFHKRTIGQPLREQFSRKGESFSSLEMESIPEFQSQEKRAYTVNGRRNSHPPPPDLAYAMSVLDQHQLAAAAQKR